ncbi:MAG: CorA family divalent cation transporter [Chitinophagaceae bacterium]
MAQTEQFISEGIKWIDETNPTKEEVAELSKTYNLSHHIVQDCMQPEHLPKFEIVEDVQFMILRYLSKEDTIGTTIQEITNKIAIFYTDNFLITIHKSQTPFIEDIRKRFQTVSKPATTTEVILKIVWNALETFDGRADTLSSQVDIYENEVMQRKTPNRQMEALYHIKREASLSNKVLMLMQEPINHFFPKPGEEPLVQDVKDQLLKMRTLYGQILEDINNLMNLLISFSAQLQTM